MEEALLRNGAPVRGQGGGQAQGQGGEGQLHVAEPDGNVRTLWGTGINKLLTYLN